MVTDLVSEDINMELVLKKIESTCIEIPIKEEFIKEEAEIVSSNEVDIAEELAYRQAKLYFLSAKMLQKARESLELNQQNMGIKTYSLVKSK